MTEPQIIEAVRVKYKLPKSYFPPQWWLIRTRKPRLATPSFLIMAILRYGLGYQLTRISYMFGISVESVHHALQIVRSNYKLYAGYRSILDSILEQLGDTEMIKRMQNNDIAELNDLYKQRTKQQ